MRADTRSWDNTSYAAYMKARRAGLDAPVPPLPAPAMPLDLSLPGRLKFLGELTSLRCTHYAGGGKREVAIPKHRSLHEVLAGLLDNPHPRLPGGAKELGFLICTDGQFYCAEERKVIVDGAQIVIPAGNGLMSP